jgi:hypothetical protein
MNKMIEISEDKENLKMGYFIFLPSIILIIGTLTFTGLAKSEVMVNLL